MNITFIAISILVVLWAVLFVASRETRREMLIMSLIMMIATPGALYLASGDYRAGTMLDEVFIPIDSFILAFTLGGLAAMVYHFLLEKKFSTFRDKKREQVTPDLAHWIAHLVVLFGIWGFIAVFLTFVFAMNPVHSLIVGGVMVGLYIVADRKDLLFDALLSAVLMAGLVFILEQIFFVRFYPEITAELYFGSVPLEEIAWAATIGFTFGPLYEYARHLKLR